MTTLATAPAPRAAARRRPRASRATLVKLASSDFPDRREAAYTAELERLRKVGGGSGDLKSVTAAITKNRARIDEARARRKNLAQVAMIYNNAGGRTLLEATGLSMTALHDFKLEAVGLTHLPKIDGGPRVDRQMMRTLAEARGLRPNPAAVTDLPEAAAAVARLEGKLQAAYELRDEITRDLVLDEGLTRVEVSAMIGRLPCQVSRTVARHTTDEE